MSEIISNSTPIIGLSMIERLDLLLELFDRVFVPEAVFKEVTENHSSRSYGEKELIRAVEQGDIYVYKIQNNDLIKKMYGRLHDGELEVIVGAKELKFRYVLMDERSARSVAKTFLLRPIGTLGILILAKQSGLLKEIKPYLDRLTEMDFYISKGLYHTVLSRVDEI